MEKRLLFNGYLLYILILILFGSYFFSFIIEYLYKKKINDMGIIFHFIDMIGFILFITGIFIFNSLFFRERRVLGCLLSLLPFIIFNINEFSNWYEQETFTRFTNDKNNPNIDISYTITRYRYEFNSVSFEHWLICLFSFVVVLFVVYYFYIIKSKKNVWEF